MFLWDMTSPERDGGLENDIPTHEVRTRLAWRVRQLTHGVAT